MITIEALTDMVTEINKKREISTSMDIKQQVSLLEPYLDNDYTLRMIMSEMYGGADVKINKNPSKDEDFISIYIGGVNSNKYFTNDIAEMIRRVRDETN